MSELKAILSTGPDRRPDEIISTALETVRRHFRMEVAYLSEFVDDKIIFRAVNAPGFEALIKPGDSMPVEQVYCQQILTGRVPNLIPDTAREPSVQDIPITHAAPIGSHVSLPVLRADGTAYGMFCCLARTARPDLNLRDLEVMQLFADVASGQVNRSLRRIAEQTDKEQQIAAIIDGQTLKPHYQRITALTDGRTVGFEALTRFGQHPPRSPDAWFAIAAEVGRGADLELAAVRLALGALPHLPADVYLSVNASPDLVQGGHLAAILGDQPCHRIVLELTEHAAVTDKDRFYAEMFKLRAMGLRLAVDDAGAGYSGLQHIVQLQPDIIKLDMSLTRNVDVDPIRRSLAAALVSFGSETGAVIVAEGIEAQAEADTLRRIGVALGQGFLFGRPMPLAQALAESASPPASCA